MIRTKIATIGLSMALVLGVAVTPASAQSIAELQAQINALMAQLAALQGGTTVSTGVTFTQDLTIGSTGAEVTALQQMLVSQGYLVMPQGVAFGYFGSLTQAAVAKWQAANGVSPAAGYWGPVSRARAAALGVTGGTTTGGTVTGGTTTGGTISTPGVEGTLSAVLSSEGSGAELSEGENKEVVMGIELEADQSDIRVERIQVNLDTTEDEDFYRDFADKIYIMSGDTVLASRDIDDDTVVEDSSGNLSITLSGMNFVVAEGEEEVITIALDALSNIDSADEGKTLSLTIPVNGIRGVDGAGINEYAPDTAITQSFDTEGVTAGDLDLSEGDTNPDVNSVVFIDEDEETEGVLMLAFDLEANDQDVTVDDIPVGFTSAGDEVDGAANRIILKRDGKTIDSISVPASAGMFYLATFDNLDEDIDEGDTAEFEVYVDLNDADLTTFASGTTMYATTTASDSGWDVEDSNGDDVTPDGGTVTGGTMTFRTGGLSVESRSTSAQSFPQETVANSYATYTISFDVTAFDDDAYIYNGAASSTAASTASQGVGYDIEGGWTGGTESPVLSSTADTSGSYFVVEEGQTETFTLTVTLNATTTGTYAVELTDVASATSATETGSVSTVVDQDDQAFQTDFVYIPS